MFKDRPELIRYVIKNFPEVTDHRLTEDHWDLFCTTCKIRVGFQVKTRSAHQFNGRVDTNSPVNYHFECPVCRSFKIWLIFESLFKITKKDGQTEQTTRYFRVTSIPSEGLEDIDELPENPSALRNAYREAIRAMDANAHCAAAAMFRRALQVITRNMLGARPGSLANELREVVGKSYNGAVVTNNFSDVGYIIEEAGNQAAHPDEDPDLLDFTLQDTEDLQKIFMELVSELFIVPEATKRSRAEFLARRKISSSTKSAS